MTMPTARLVVDAAATRRTYQARDLAVVRVSVRFSAEGHAYSTPLEPSTDGLEVRGDRSGVLRARLVIRREAAEAAAREPHYAMTPDLYAQLDRDAALEHGYVPIQPAGRGRLVCDLTANMQPADSLEALAARLRLPTDTDTTALRLDARLAIQRGIPQPERMAPLPVYVVLGGSLSPEHLTDLAPGAESGELLIEAA